MFTQFFFAVILSMPPHLRYISELSLYSDQGLFQISKNVSSNIIECVGPEIITFKEILQRLLKLIDKKRFLIPFPLFVANLTAQFFQLFPNPILTQDQLRLLKYDNVPSGKYKTNADIGVPSKRFFVSEVKKYCYMWKEGGEFSKEKYKTD